MSEITDSDAPTGRTVSSPGTIHDFHDPACDDGIGYAVVTAVAAARGTDPVDLPPLYDSVDIDAVGALLDGAQDRSDDVDGRVTFAYAGFDVTVNFDGWIRLDPTDGPSTAR